MKERINTSLHSISLAVLFALAAWYFIAGGMTTPYLLTIMILVLVVIEVISLIIISGTYPEGHTSFKIGIIAALLVLLGIKSMLPSFFVPLTITVFCINFLYNFYTTNKRRKGTFKRRNRGRMKF
ncbi:hypothetical protein [Negadavirga shengliensis]|uniref:Uncharacterized protein n=1 Tax=Negadavirga shengliensis TaxID=1389218 RepID=A0ABV9SWD1_9BACT